MPATKFKRGVSETSFRALISDRTLLFEETKCRKKHSIKDQLIEFE